VIYTCDRENRRALVLDHSALNGIDYLEVVDGTTEQKTLALTLLKDARSLVLLPSQVLITGGETITDVSVLSVTPATAAQPETLTLHVDKGGDFSNYTLSLIGASSTETLSGFDPALSSVVFSFKAGCPATGDCATTVCCPPTVAAEPDINYLAKDYPGFLQVMYDRLSVIMPDWTERNPADIGVALVEILAYLADHLSYRQDAVATEAYLGTARSRISLRRHARLVDYTIGEGSNARAWIHFDVKSDIALPHGSQVFPRMAALPPLIVRATRTYDQVVATNPIVFETMADAQLHSEQNQMSFYTWSDADCCLPAGATEATLVGSLTTLVAGDVLIFQEVRGPQTGDAEDADPTHRWAVRLTSVNFLDGSSRPLIDPVTNAAITQIAWTDADALPFALCVSSTADLGHDAKPLSDVSVAIGNNVPTDHGLSRDSEILGVVPAARAAPAAAAGGGCSNAPAPAAPPPFFFPALQYAPLTFARTYDPNDPGPASGFAGQNETAPVACISVKDDSSADPNWTVSGDLLGAGELDQKFVVEIEQDGTAFLRFGDGQFGMAPASGSQFKGSYRTGNGTVGNVGADTLGHVSPNPIILADYSPILAVRNPLAGAGGMDADTAEDIRQMAPFQFRTQLRAVTEDDYGVAAMRDARIREARASLRWTGSWRTAFVTADPIIGLPWSDNLAADLKSEVDLMRMTGVDLEIEQAVIVGLRVELHICVAPGYFRTHVRQALLDIFTSGTKPDGSPGLLNPVNFTFGQTIYVSPLIAAAQAIDGVAAVEVTKFQRVDDPAIDGSLAGFLVMQRLEIAHVDNDPSRPDLGVFALDMDGGQ
jgi:hypothetical protein